MCLKELQFPVWHSEILEGGWPSQMLGRESREEGPPNDRKHGRQTPSTESENEPKRICLEGDTPMGTPLPTQVTPARLEGWWRRPPPEILPVKISTELGVEKEAEIAWRLQNMDEQLRKVLENQAMAEAECQKWTLMMVSRLQNQEEKYKNLLDQHEEKTTEAMENLVHIHERKVGEALALRPLEGGS